MQTNYKITKSFVDTVPLLALGLALTSCTSLNLRPEPTTVSPSEILVDEIDVKKKWTTAAPDALPTTDWVRMFSDTLLTELVDEALRKNTDIRSAYHVLESTIASERISRAGKWPSISGSFGLSRTEGANEFFPDNTDISSGLNASWEPDFWGRISDRIDGAKLDSDAAASDVAAIRLSITGQVVQLWFSLIEAQLLKDLSDRDIATQTRALRLTQKRFESGVVGNSDVRLARTALAQAISNQALRRQVFSALSREIETVLGLYPSGDIVARNDFPDLPPLQGVGTPNYILTQRPDLIAAERRLSAQGLEIDLAKKALLPSLSFSGSTTANGDKLKRFFDIDALVASLAGNLTAPIFEGGRIRAQIEIEETVLREQLESYIGTVLEAYRDVENALDGEIRLTESVEALKVAVKQAKEAEKRLEIRYAAGLVTILQLLDSQTRRLSAEGQLISARAERLQNRVSLHVALGGGVYGDIPPDALPAILRESSLILEPRLK